MNNPLVSVIVLTYNQCATIRKAIDSILCQTCNFPYEILIGDDASTDNTPDVLAEYAAYEQIKIFRRDNNLGVTKNAYDLLSRAKGKYIASCEGDDSWCDPCKLQKQVSFLETHPDFVGCSHEVNLVNEEGTVYSTKPVSWISKKRTYSYKNFQGYYLPGQSGSIVKRNIFSDNKTDCSLLVTASEKIGDRTTVLLCLQYGKFYRMKDRMANYMLSFGKKNRSVTANYTNQLDFNRQEWIFTERLEEYARKHFPQKVSFEHYKRNIFANSVYKKFFGGPNADKSLPKEILNAANNKFTYLVAFPFWFVIKLCRKIKLVCLRKSYENSFGNSNSR